MANRNLKLSDRLFEAKIMIENALSDIEIKSSLGIFGYDETKLKIGRGLYEELQDLINKQKKEYGEQYEATEDTQKAWGKANAVYIKTIKVARVALQNNTKAITSMMLFSDRKQNLSGWLIQAEAFYKNLVNDAELMNLMQNFGYTIDKLNNEYLLVKDVMEKSLKQKKETGEAHESTEIRDKKLDELDKWISDFRAIVKIALEETPQKLEKLGLLARSEGSKSKKNNA